MVSLARGGSLDPAALREAVAAGQDTLNSCPSPGELGVDCRAQVFPFQRITTVTSLADPVMSWSPTAVHACGEEQDTALSSLISVCARLGGWTGYYGKPGPKVMRIGLADFRAIKQGYTMAPHDV